jgi:hypothetical protein
MHLEEDEVALDLPGKSVPIILSTLVEKVYVSPTASKWVVDAVTKLVQKYGLDAPVVQSNLYAPVVK